jgi:hypothetical protein
MMPTLWLLVSPLNLALPSACARLAKYANVSTICYCTLRAPFNFREHSLKQTGNSPWSELDANKFFDIRKIQI